MRFRMITKLIATGLSAGCVSFAFANGYSYVNDFDAVGYYDCDANSSALDVTWAEVYCLSGACTVLLLTCDGPLDPDAKYRFHFDTEEPYFWQNDNNEECITTSDHTAMYRPGRDKYTGPKSFGGSLGFDYLSFYFHWDELGIEAGDYVAVWVDVHKKGIQSRAPETDDEDGCAKPQYPSNDGNFGLLGEAMIVCADGVCNFPPAD